MQSQGKAELGEGGGGTPETPRQGGPQPTEGDADIRRDNRCAVSRIGNAHLEGQLVKPCQRFAVQHYAIRAGRTREPQQGIEKYIARAVEPRAV